MVQNVYPIDIKKDRKFLQNNYDDERYASFFVNPVTHDLNLAFDHAKRNVVVTYDDNLKLVKHHTVTSKQAPNHNLWLIGQSYASIANLGMPQMEVPSLYAATCQTSYFRKIHELAERTTPSSKDKSADVPRFYCQLQPNDGVLVIRSLDKIGTQIDIYAL